MFIPGWVDWPKPSDKGPLDTGAPHMLSRGRRRHVKGVTPDVRRADALNRPTGLEILVNDPHYLLAVASQPH